MNIEQLKYFKAVSDFKTFSNAAIEMNITQSALSKQIMKLEQELDVSLFDRSHRQIILTYNGQILLNDVNNILNNYQNMINHVTDIKKADSLNLKIAMLPIFSQYNLSTKIKNFIDMNPNFHLDIHEIEEKDLSYQMTQNNFDIYILRGYLPKSISYQCVELYKDKLVAIISNNNPLSSLSSISIQKLKNQKLLFMPKHTEIAKISTKACIDAGFNPLIQRYGRLETILSSANDNDGIALVMYNSLHIFHLSKVCVIPITEDIHGNIKLYHSNNHTKRNIIHEFINSIHYEIQTKI